MQSQGIEVFTANPGIAQTPLNNVKLDRNKLTANLVDITSNLIGQSAEEASYCISRPATDPTVSGELVLLILAAHAPDASQGASLLLCS